MAKKPQTEHAENKWKSLGVHNLRVSFCFFFFLSFFPKSNCTLGTRCMTLWLPGQTACTHQLVVKPHSKASIQCAWLANGSFQLTYMSRDGYTLRVERAMVARRKTKNYYSAHIFVTSVSFGTQASVSVYLQLLWHSQNLPEPFLRAVLPMKVKVSTPARVIPMGRRKHS